jgi:hypothetical protein
MGSEVTKFIFLHPTVEDSLCVINFRKRGQFVINRLIFPACQNRKKFFLDEDCSNNNIIIEEFLILLGLN